MERDTFYDPIEIHVCPTCGGIVKEPIKAKVPDQPVEETDIETFLVRLGRPHIKTAFRGDGNPTDNQVAREIGSSLIQLHLGLAEKVEDIDAPKRESGELIEFAEKLLDAMDWVGTGTSESGKQEEKNLREELAEIIRKLR